MKQFENYSNTLSTTSKWCRRPIHSIMISTEIRGADFEYFIKRSRLKYLSLHRHVETYCRDQIEQHAGIILINKVHDDFVTISGISSTLL